MNPTVPSAKSNKQSAVVSPIANLSQEIKTPEFSEWLTSIYSEQPSDEELNEMYNTLKYQGFDRNEVLAQIKNLNLSKKLLMEMILVCALRGPVQASQTPLSNKQTLSSMGVGGNGGKGQKRLTCQKVTAATADLAASYMKRLNVPKRIPSIDLPGWLQFPAAGSIKMSDAIRAKHVEFSLEFSKRIGGQFNEQIYEQMKENSYLSDKLKLF
jgi:hypothetical protein